MADTPGDGDLLNDLRWVLCIWDRVIGRKALTDLVEAQVLRLEEVADAAKLFQQLDLALAFFQHYVYALEEFMNRKFRDAVIRCGLTCERLVQRLAVAAGHPEVLDIRAFDDQANRLRYELSQNYPNAEHMINLMRYVYQWRSRKGAHDTGTARAIIAKSCVSQLPSIYLLYLEALAALGNSVELEDDLVDLVNSTLTTGTTLVVAEAGKPTAPAQVLESLYKQGFFSLPKSQREVVVELQRFKYRFPRTTLQSALEHMVRDKMLTKGRTGYVQRTPPSEFYKAEIG